MTTNCTSELVNQPDVGIINTNGRLLNAQPLNGDKGERKGNFFFLLFFSFPLLFFFVFLLSLIGFIDDCF